MTDALALLKEQQGKILMMNMVYGSDCKVVGELVRCKDCKYRSEKTYTHGITNKEVLVCQINDLAKEPDWFCADGELKDNG